MEVVPILALLVAAGLLAALVAVDLRERRLPDGLNLALALAALVFHAAGDGDSATGPELVAGAVLGAGFFYLLRAVFFRLRGVEALGLGDVKFMAAAGLWVGIWGIGPLILIAATTTLLVAVLRHAGALSSEGLRRRRIPVGPRIEWIS
jgi:leader peptidase (prepilin peptidase)/N-methyltransferase